MQLKLKKLIAILISLIIATQIIQAQEISNLVPKESLFSGMIDLKQIDSKANIAEMIKLPLFKKMDKKILKLLIGQNTNKDSMNILDFKKSGIDVGNKAWLFVKTSNEMIYGAFLFPLADEAKFSSFANKLVKPDEGIDIKNAGSYKYLNIKKLNFAWNSKILAIYGNTISPSFKDSLRRQLEPKNSYNDYYNQNNYSKDTAVTELSIKPDYIESTDTLKTTLPDMTGIENVVADTVTPYNNNYYNSYLDIYDQVNKKCDSIENFWAETHASLFLESKGPNSISQNKDFLQYIKTSPDMAFVFDYGKIIDLQNVKSSSYVYSSYASILGIRNDFLKEYYDGISLFGKVELNKDDIKLNIDMKFSKLMTELYKDVKKTKVDNKFLKYLNNDLMGYFAFGVDVKGIGKGLENTMRRFYPTIPEYGEIAASVHDVLDIFIDQEAIYNLFTGDMVVALNGIKPVQVPHISYNYDENYNMTEKMDTTTQMQPEVLCMIGVGNANDVNKILKLLISLKALKQEGNVYSITYLSKDLPIFLRIYDNILFISNNKMNVEQPVVVQTNKQLNKDHAKIFNMNTSILYANIAEISKSLANQGNPRHEKIINNISNTFSTVKFYGGVKNGHSVGFGVLELTKTNENSLSDIIQFLNYLYLNRSARFD